MTAVTIYSDFGGQENKVCHCFPIYLLWSNGITCHDLRFFIKRLFSSSLLSPIKEVSSAYLRLLIFLQAILISACVHHGAALLPPLSHQQEKRSRAGQNSIRRYENQAKAQPELSPFPENTPPTLQAPDGDNQIRLLFSR